MRTFWKIAITFGVFALFLLAIVAIVFLIGEVFVMPSFGNTVVVIPVKGEIAFECGGDLFGAYQCARVADIKDRLSEADENPMVKAIVLDINSGGGGVVASSALMEAVRNTEKPVVAYIGEAGASGAYYVASASDKIVADKNSITGSIGVIMTIQHYYGLYEKLGINVTVIKAGESKDIGSPYRSMTPEEEDELREMVEKIHYDFVTNVAENRENLNRSVVEELADGSIYLGIEAKNNGLVDEIGTIEDAIDFAAELGDVKGEPVVEKEEPAREISLLDLFTKYERIIKWVE